MKILNVIGSIDLRGGGTTNHVLAISRIWARRGHECHVLCLDPPDAVGVRESPAVTIALGGRRRGRLGSAISFGRYGYTPALTEWFYHHARSYDTVILNGLWNYTSYGSWRALRKVGVPYYVCPHGMLDPWLRKTRPASHLLRILFWGLIERRVIRDARAILFACEEERRLANDGFLQGRFRQYVGGYGTEDVEGDRAAQRDAFLARCPRLRDRRAILFIGRIHPKKGVDVLIRAFSSVAREFGDFDLIIAGPDDIGLATQLKRIAAELKMEERIHWTGMLSGDEKWGAFAFAEFFALASHQENFGIAVVEAMALSLPVLITRQVNIWREVEMSQSGRAVNDNVAEFSQGLRYMCALSSGERRSMGRKARDCFTREFDAEKNASSLLNLISSLNEVEKNRNGKKQGNSRR